MGDVYEEGDEKFFMLCYQHKNGHEKSVDFGLLKRK